MSWFPRRNLDVSWDLVDPGRVAYHDGNGLGGWPNLDLGIAPIGPRARDDKRCLGSSPLLRNIRGRSARDLDGVFLLEDRLVIIGEATRKLAGRMAKVLLKRLRPLGKNPI